MATVLVVTHWFDPTADFVVEELNKRDVSVMRVDTADFPKSLNLAAVIESDGWRCDLRLGDRSVSLEDVAGIYFRRPTVFDFGEMAQSSAP